VGNRIARNGLGVLVTTKNWRYGVGGRAVLHENEMVENGEDLRVADDRSRVTRSASSVSAELFDRLVAVRIGAEVPLFDWRFVESFDSNADGFVTTLPARVYKRGPELVLRGRRQLAVARRSLDPPIEVTGDAHLVVEARTEGGVGTVRLIFDDGSAERMTIDQDDGTFELAASRISGPKTAVAVELAVERTSARPGHLVLQRLLLLGPAPP
jgi:hypothetical protein